MGLPNVDIEVKDGALGGSVSIEDGIAGLALSAPAPSGLALSTPIAIFSLEDAVALGIDEAFDTDNTVDAYHQIKDFYIEAPTGTELWIIIIPQATTMASACDKTGNIVKAMLTAAQGKIKIWGITRVPDVGYVPTHVDGFDDDASAAVLKADELCEELTTQFNPCRALVGCRDYQSVVGDLKDFKQNTDKRVGVVLGSTSASGYPAVGRVLGRFASIAVQRKISRRKDGDLGLTDAYLSDGVSVDGIAASFDSIHDKGYIFMHTIPNVNGYYFNSDPACVSDASDYSSLARGRVIDKAIRIAYATFIEEVEDDIDIDDNGNMSPVVVKYYQEKIIGAISTSMQGEISGVECYIDPAQDVLATNKVVVDSLKIRPRGYSSFIDVKLGFDNPQNN